jgi:hypothetical protein
MIMIRGSIITKIITKITVEVHENDMMMVIAIVVIIVTVEADDLVEIVATVEADQIAAIEKTETVNVTEIKILDKTVMMTIEIGNALREVKTEAVIENVNEIVIDLIAAKKNKGVIRNVVEAKSVLIKTVLTVEKENLKMTRMERIQIRPKVQMVTILIETQDEMMMIVIEMVIQVVKVINVLDVRMKLTAAEEMVVNINTVAKVALIKVQEQDRLVMITLMMKERLIKPMTMTFLLLMITNPLMTMIFLTLHRLWLFLLRNLSQQHYRRLII